MIKLPSIINQISKQIIKHNGQPILVGGAIRDHLLGLPTKDFDIEVYGIKTLSQLKEILKSFGPLNEVGKAFSVLKLNYENIEIDFALPRTEEKTGSGHRGFKMTPAPNSNFAEIAARRDFTINALGFDLQNKELLDPFNGQKDLKNSILRHIGPKFVEDPLRVLRAMQFAARFNLSIAPKTLEICQACDLKELPKDRVFEELKKLLLKAKKPSIGLNLMWDLGIIDLFPELKKLKHTKQDKQWHPEGDVWQHTMLVVDEMAKLCKNEKPNVKLIYMLAALCHDLGKPNTTEFQNNRIRSHGHEKQGTEPTKSFLQRLTNQKELFA